MTDKLNITIRIAGLAPLALQINREDEEVCRTAEYQVNRLNSLWSDRFGNKSRMEVLAMVAYQFAQLYYTQNRSQEQCAKELAKFEADLDEILLDVDPGRG
ncbi:MAG: cell division protein ZapA [Muribaculaceae bacterium]|nr:cell division protein ZapA [Muribaculaceae bacterium]